MDPNQNQQNSSHQVDNLELLRGLREQRRSNEDQVQARIDAMSKENPQMRLSPREQALMRECNNESFWQRSAPLSLLMGTAVTVAARTGKIKGTRVFPKSLAAAMIGYFAGKISYMPICRDKFLTQEPHGDMAKAIRKAQNLPEPAVSEFASNSPPEVEAYQPEMQSADSSPQTLQPDPSTNSGAMSYEKLRENRRIADRLSQPQKYQPLQPNWSEQGGDIPPQQPLRVPPSQPEATSDFRIERSQPQRSAKTNKYGDEGFE